MYQTKTASAILQQAGFEWQLLMHKSSLVVICTLQHCMAVRVVQFGDTQLRIADQTYLDDHAGAVIWDAGLVLAHYLHHSTKAIGECCHAMTALVHHGPACANILRP